MLGAAHCKWQWFPLMPEQLTQKFHFLFLHHFLISFLKMNMIKAMIISPQIGIAIMFYSSRMGGMMTEYANPIVNAAVKLGMNKKEALLMADNTAEIDFEAIRKLNKSVV